jgi:hypothetical protein
LVVKWEKSGMQMVLRMRRTEWLGIRNGKRQKKARIWKGAGV